LSLGRASVSASGPEALYNNPAGLNNFSGFLVNINALRRYNIAGLDYYSGGMAYGIGNSIFSLRLMQQGLDDFQESNFGFSYTRKLAESIVTCVTFNYNHLSQSEFSGKVFFTFDIGLQSKVSEKFILGMSIVNPTNRKIDDFHAINAGIRLGSKFLISNELNIYTEIQKNIGFDPEIKVGIEYSIVENFNVLIGVIPTYSEYSFGLSYRFNNTMQINGAFLYDQRIDISPAFGLTYNANQQ
jgi:hypothetical protein